MIESLRDAALTMGLRLRPLAPGQKADLKRDDNRLNVHIDPLGVITLLTLG